MSFDLVNKPFQSQTITALKKLDTDKAGPKDGLTRISVDELKELDKKGNNDGVLDDAELEKAGIAKEDYATIRDAAKDAAAFDPKGQVIAFSTKSNALFVAKTELTPTTMINPANPKLTGRKLDFRMAVLGKEVDNLLENRGKQSAAFQAGIDKLDAKKKEIEGLKTNPKLSKETVAKLDALLKILDDQKVALGKKKTEFDAKTEKIKSFQPLIKAEPRNEDTIMAIQSFLKTEDPKLDLGATKNHSGQGTDGLDGDYGSLTDKATVAYITKSQEPLTLPEDPKTPALDEAKKEIETKTKEEVDAKAKVETDKAADEAKKKDTEGVRKQLWGYVKDDDDDNLRTVLKTASTSPKFSAELKAAMEVDPSLAAKLAEVLFTGNYSDEDATAMGQLFAHANDTGKQAMIDYAIKKDRSDIASQFNTEGLAKAIKPEQVAGMLKLLGGAKVQEMGNHVMTNAVKEPTPENLKLLDTMTKSATAPMRVGFKTAITSLGAKNIATAFKHIEVAKSVLYSIDNTNMPQKSKQIQELFSSLPPKGQLYVLKHFNDKKDSSAQLCLAQSIKSDPATFKGLWELGKGQIEHLIDKGNLPPTLSRDLLDLRAKALEEEAKIKAAEEESKKKV